MKGHGEDFTVEWFKGFKVVNINEGSYGFIRDNQNRLFFIIKNCQKSDAGSYKVVVKSSVTTSELKFETFKVKGLIIINNKGILLNYTNMFTDDLFDFYYDSNDTE